jgi:hypothetical protein
MIFSENRYPLFGIMLWPLSRHDSSRIEHISSAVPPKPDMPMGAAPALSLVAANVALERDDFSSNRHHALTSSWSMIFSENRYPLFGIML